MRDIGPLHDRVQLSPAELKVIAELERVANGPTAPVPVHDVSLRHSRWRAVVSFLARWLPWVAPIGLVLVLLPLVVAWRVIGLLVFAVGLTQSVARAVARARSRNRRALP
jgi:hypothetical protein